MRHYWLVEPGQKPGKVPIPVGGTQPFQDGPVVARSVTGWPDAEVDNAIHQVTSMAPQARLILAPVLALPLAARPHPHFDEMTGNVATRHDNRLVTTKYPWAMYATNGLFFPKIGTIFVSLSSTISPSMIANHETWHYAETTLLTDKEVSLIGAAYGVIAAFKAKAGATMHFGEPSEWAACAFVEWLSLYNSTLMVEMEEPFETLFHGLASGAMAKRRVVEPRLDVDEIYLSCAAEVDPE